jgi:alkylhydroperoxidase family enzyme
VIRAALEAGDIEAGPFSPGEVAALRYAEALTRDPGGVDETMVRDLREAGWSDGEILEINQVTAYFAYANRTVLGLGCSTDGDVLGLSPGNSDDPQDWGHR